MQSIQSPAALGFRAAGAGRKAEVIPSRAAFGRKAAPRGAVMVQAIFGTKVRGLSAVHTCNAGRAA